MGIAQNESRDVGAVCCKMVVLYHFLFPVRRIRPILV